MHTHPSPPATTCHPWPTILAQPSTHPMLYYLSCTHFIFHSKVGLAQGREILLSKTRRHQLLEHLKTYHSIPFFDYIAFPGHYSSHSSILPLTSVQRSFHLAIYCLKNILGGGGGIMDTKIALGVYSSQAQSCIFCYIIIPIPIILK